MGQESVRTLRDALKRLPTGSDAYDCAYIDAMKRIEAQAKHQIELVKKALSWITCARGQLNTLELRHALAVRLGDIDVNREGLLEVQDIVSACAGLVEVDKESGIIRLVQHIPQEYFEQIQNI
jgi:hypothetical protein